MASRRSLVALLIVAGATMASVAHAEPSAADKETARSLMAEGRTDREKGDLKGALKAFEAADAIMHVPTTGLELARTQVALGQLVEARDTALRVARNPEKPGDPMPFKQAREAAATLNSELEGRIPSLTVNVKNVPDGAAASVTLDGSALPQASLGEPRKLDPGHHVLVAHAGTAEGKQEIDIAEKEARTVTIELPAQQAGSASPPGDSSTAEAAPPAEQAPPEGRSGTSKALIFGGFGLAGAGVIAGSVTGLLTISKANGIKSNAACNGNLCGTGIDSDLSSAKTLATLSTVSFIVAGAGAVAGVLGLLTGNSSSQPGSAPEPGQPAADKDESARIEPWFGLGSMGLRGRF
jgi:hypothetical protein